MVKSKAKLLFAAMSLLLIACNTYAADQKTYLLQLKAKSGDKYRDVLISRERQSIPEFGIEKRDYTKVTSETTVDAVQARGRMILNEKTLHVRKIIEAGGKEIIIDTADDRQIRELLKRDDIEPLVTGIQNLLTASVRVTMEPNGAIRRFDTEHSDVDNHELEINMTNPGNVVFPEKPVKVNDIWTSSPISFSLPPFGHFQDTYFSMTLRRIGVLNGEQVAYVDVKRILTTFKQDDMTAASAKIELTHADSSGLVVLAIERGHIISSSFRGSSTFNITEKGLTMTMILYSEITKSEIK